MTYCSKLYFDKRDNIKEITNESYCEIQDIMRKYKRNQLTVMIISNFKTLVNEFTIRRQLAIPIIINFIIYSIPSLLLLVVVI